VGEFSSPRVIASDSVAIQTVQSIRLLSSGIANAKLLLSFSAKESNQRKLPAAPASLKGGALTSGVVAEPDDAGLGG